MNNVHQLPMFSDNFAFLIVNDNHNCAVVDPGDANLILDYVTNNHLIVTDILLTHHHWDHTDGVEAMIKHFPKVNVYGPDTERFPWVTQPVTDGETLELTALSLRLEVWELPGHTRDHVGYYNDKFAFVGDTLFSAGCGRIKEGLPKQLFASLHKIKQLADTTAIYCAHEYTQANIEFALAVEPENIELKQYHREVTSLRANNKYSIPTNNAIEKNINPFLRTHVPCIQNIVKEKFKLLATPDEVTTFTYLRKWKDKF